MARVSPTEACSQGAGDGHSKHMHLYPTIRQLSHCPAQMWTPGARCAPVGPVCGCSTAVLRWRLMRCTFRGIYCSPAACSNNPTAHDSESMSISVLKASSPGPPPQGRAVDGFWTSPVLGFHAECNSLHHVHERDVERVALSVDLISTVLSNAFAHHLQGRLPSNAANGHDWDTGSAPFGDVCCRR